MSALVRDVPAVFALLAVNGSVGVPESVDEMFAELGRMVDPTVSGVAARASGSG